MIVLKVYKLMGICFGMTKNKLLRCYIENHPNTIAYLKKFLSYRHRILCSYFTLYHNNYNNNNMY